MPYIFIIFLHERRFLYFFLRVDSLRKEVCLNNVDVVYVYANTFMSPASGTGFLQRQKVKARSMRNPMEISPR